MHGLLEACSVVELRFSWVPLLLVRGRSGLHRLRVGLGPYLYQATACAFDCLQRPILKSNSEGPPYLGSCLGHSPAQRPP